MISRILKMTIRTSSRSITSTASASSSKRTLVQPQSENDSATKDTENSTTTSRSKRARYVPPALNTENAPVAVKVERQEESIVQSELSTPLRYSLRRKVSGNGIVKSESDEITPMFKMEDGEEEIESTISTPKKKGTKVKKEAADPFAVSPRKTSVKPIKLDLEEHEVKPAPKRWKEQLEVLTKQRKRIIAPVDTLGCEENGRDEKRKDLREMVESPEESAKRARFTTLVSLMLSSQTKDPVTAEAVHNLQRNLPNGLCLDSILNATQDQISSNINKVGFWRRKTGYIQSAARILRDDFEGDVPKTIDELCSLPGVGPKMGFLALQSAWNINVGIGVDVHVHRVSNRLKWVKSNDPEGTRLQLQSWLPKELHRTINKTLVGFGQVICQPVGPRCDLCALGAAKLCPSYRKVDPKSIASRVKVELLPEEDEVANELNVEATDAVKLEGPEGSGTLLVKEEDERLDW
jgi:endonuclease III